MGRKLQDLSGQKFGDWTVLEFYDKVIKYGKNIYIRYLCECACGNISVVYAYSLRKKVRGTKSCGCHINGEWNKTHGMYGTSEYHSWQAMKQRCYNENKESYSYYGGRGIKVCDRWLNSFENFFEDMGFKTSPEHTLGRFDNNGNYEPDNCFWDTQEEQANNKSNTRKYYYNGEELSITQWARKLNISENVLKYRLNKNIPFEEAIKNCIIDARSKAEL